MNQNLDSFLFILHPSSLILLPLVAPAAAITATAATAATTEPAATVATRSTASAFGPRPRLVDGEGAPVRLFAVQGGDGGLGLLVGLHFHKPEALGPSRVPVHDDLGRLHRAVRLEHLDEIAVAHRVAQVADVQLLTHWLTPQREAARSARRRKAGLRNTPPPPCAEGFHSSAGASAGTGSGM